jgi:hypothetical protein
MPYIVQFVVIKEIEVDSLNDIQAEKDAFAKLSVHDRASTIAYHVVEDDNLEAALNGDPSVGWKFARDRFETAYADVLADD